MVVRKATGPWELALTGPTPGRSSAKAFQQAWGAPGRAAGDRRGPGRGAVDRGWCAQRSRSAAGAQPKRSRSAAGAEPERGRSRLGQHERVRALSALPKAGMGRGKAVRPRGWDADDTGER